MKSAQHNTPTRSESSPSKSFPESSSGWIAMNEQLENDRYRNGDGDACKQTRKLHWRGAKGRIVMVVVVNMLRDGEGTLGVHQ